MAGLAWVLAPVAIHLSLCWALGLMSGESVTSGGLIGGSALAVVVMITTSMMGESVIEDIVKLGLFALATGALWSGFEPSARAVILGMPSGAVMPLLFRLISRFSLLVRAGN